MAGLDLYSGLAHEADVASWIGSMNSLDLPSRPQDTRVVVAMSGGVDSSVVAGILKREGYDVVGVTLQLYDQGAANHRAGSCCAGRDIDDARRVCETLGVPHYVLDYEERFRKAVIDPSPKAMSPARRRSLACPATRRSSSPISSRPRATSAPTLWRPDTISAAARTAAHRALYRPVDSDRDQSYFLFATTQDQIDYLRFPLGGMAKSEVRAVAAELGLAVADKQDSQDICFVPQGRYSDIIAKLKPSAALGGDIVHIDGRVLGRHEGILHYTVGQRRGIGIASGEALYVVHLDAANARLIVGPREALETRRVYLRDLNWLGDADLDGIGPAGIEVFAKVRSTRPPRPATLHRQDGETFVELSDGESGVAPGQACVLYDDDGNARARARRRLHRPV